MRWIRLTAIACLCGILGASPAFGARIKGVRYTRMPTLSVPLSIKIRAPTIAAAPPVPLLSPRPVWQQSTTVPVVLAGIRDIGVFSKLAREWEGPPGDLSVASTPVQVADIISLCLEDRHHHSAGTLTPAMCALAASISKFAEIPMSLATEVCRTASTRPWHALVCLAASNTAVVAIGRANAVALAGLLGLEIRGHETRHGEDRADVFNDRLINRNSNWTRARSPLDQPKWNLATTLSTVTSNPREQLERALSADAPLSSRALTRNRHRVSAAWTSLIGEGTGSSLRAEGSIIALAASIALLAAVPMEAAVAVVTNYLITSTHDGRVSISGAGGGTRF